MKYLISDIHGDFFHFEKMLKEIEFKETDTMFILGDIFDRGKANIELYRELRKRNNMILLKGNHEMFAQMYLEGKIKKRQWDLWGGKYTRKQVDKLSSAERGELRRYLQELPYYIPLSVEGEEWILTHTGLGNRIVRNEDGSIHIRGSIEAAVEENPLEYLLSDLIHHVSEKEKFDAYVVVGHVPTLRLTGKAGIFHEGRYTCIDTGNGWRENGGWLSCYCIDTKEEFYI